MTELSEYSEYCTASCTACVVSEMICLVVRMLNYARLAARLPADALACLAVLRVHGSEACLMAGSEQA